MNLLYMRPLADLLSHSMRDLVLMAELESHKTEDLDFCPWDIAEAFYKNVSGIILHDSAAGPVKCLIQIKENFKIFKM